MTDQGEGQQVGQRQGKGKQYTQVVVVPPHSRVVRYRRDMVGNDLTASLMWCDTHHEPLWVYGDGSYECPHTRIIECDSEDHVIIPPPWERQPDA